MKIYKLLKRSSIILAVFYIMLSFAGFNESFALSQKINDAKKKIVLNIEPRDDKGVNIESNFTNVDYGSTNSDKNNITHNNDIENSIANAQIKEEVLKQLKSIIYEDSYRNTVLNKYYIFSFDDAISIIRSLEEKITSVSEAHDIPKSMIAATLFREIMFMGQEDLLDGMDIIGGDTIGISQIGVNNAKRNDLYVHGINSVIAFQNEDQIRDELKDINHSVYFCAMQLKARAIQITGKKDVDIQSLDDNKIKHIFQEYNQSPIKYTIGPIKTKQKYGEETFRYYKLFERYYNITK